MVDPRLQRRNAGCPTALHAAMAGGAQQRVGSIEYGNELAGFDTVGLCQCYCVQWSQLIWPC